MAKDTRNAIPWVCPLKGDSNQPVKRASSSHSLDQRFTYADLKRGLAPREPTRPGTHVTRGSAGPVNAPFELHGSAAPHRETIAEQLDGHVGPKVWLRELIQFDKLCIDMRRTGD